MTKKHRDILEPTSRRSVRSFVTKARLGNVSDCDYSDRLGKKMLQREYLRNNRRTLVQDKPLFLSLPERYISRY